jgi:hypothetical protein
MSGPLGLVYLQKIKKKAKAEGKTCHAKTMLSLEKPIKRTPHTKRNFRKMRRRRTGKKNFLLLFSDIMCVSCFVS